MDCFISDFIPTCTITGADRDNRILFGNSISCHAEANPPPSYRWSNGTGTNLSSAKSVMITNDGNYTCTASNAADSCTKSITLVTYSKLLFDIFQVLLFVK